jgi:predicted peroxiredoxin
MSEERKRLFLVVLRTGPQQPGQVRAALMFAGIAAAMEFDTVVYCVQEGADAMVKDAMDKEEPKPGVPTMKQRLAEASGLGVRLEVCEQTAKTRGITAENLIPEARILGGAKLIEYAVEAAGQLTF